MKKAVIFDLDGLLIDSEVISHRLYDELLHRYGKSVTVAEYARDYSGKTGVANMTNVIARYNLPITVEEGLTWEVAREKELLQDVQLKPGAAALLSWLKTEGVAVVLATSSVRERAVEVLTRLGVVQYFDDMVFGIQAAHAAGIDVRCVPDMKMPAESYQQMTAAMLKSLDEVKGWLTAE